MQQLKELGILIDGSPVDNYLVQIFLKDAMTLYNEPKAGPFFFELIERCGDNGFGGGNFRAPYSRLSNETSKIKRFPYTPNEFGRLHDKLS